MTNSGSPPGLGGGVGGGFGDVGEAAFNYQEMVKGMKRFNDIENNVETDPINMEKYVKELSKVCWDMFRATGAMLEREHLRFINMFTEAGSGGNGGGHRFNKGIMEHKVINNLRCVSGDKSLFRQWHKTFVNTLGQYDQCTKRSSSTSSRRLTSARTCTKSWRS